MGLEGSYLQRALPAWLLLPELDVMANGAFLLAALIESQANQSWVRTLGGDC